MRFYCRGNKELVLVWHLCKFLEKSSCSKNFKAIVSYQSILLCCASHTSLFGDAGVSNALCRTRYQHLLRLTQSDAGMTGEFNTYEPAGKLFEVWVVA
jgi:hypothetical protein